MNQLLSNKETDELGERLIGMFYKENPVKSLCVDIISYIFHRNYPPVIDG